MPTVLSFRLSIHYLLSRVGIQTRHSYLTSALAGRDRPLLQSASLRNRAWSPGVDARPSPNFPQSWYTNASFLQVGDKGKAAANNATAFRGSLCRTVISIG